MIWTDDTGAVEIKSSSGGWAISVPGQRGITLHQTSRGRGARWIEGSASHGIAVCQRDDELLVVHTWSDPTAEGTEADPRTASVEWTLARVIEQT